MESCNWIFGGSGENKSMFVFLRGRSVKLFDANQLFFALKGEGSVFLYELLKKEKREICSIGKIFDF